MMTKPIFVPGGKRTLIQLPAVAVLTNTERKSPSMALSTVKAELNVLLA